MSHIRFFKFASDQPHKVALIDPSGRQWSRGELASCATRVSRRLLSGGCSKGDVLVAIAPNGAEYMAAYLAATQIGMYFVPVNWHLSPAEMAYIFTDCKPRVLIAHERFVKSVESVLSRLETPPEIRLSIGTMPNFTPISALDRESALPILNPIDGRMLAYTSATTGRPKGVLLPLESATKCLDRIIERRIARGLEVEKHVHLGTSMLYHGAALETVAISLHMGHEVILIDTPTPERILELIEEHSVTTLYLAPTMFSRLLRLDEEIRRRYSTGSLAQVMHLGVSCPVEVKRKMIEWWGPILWESYGAVEGQGTIVNSIEWLRFPGTVGRPIRGSKLKILGEDGKEIPRNNVGTIYMTRYTGDRFIYLGDPEKTRAAYAGEFFTVGDIGYVNDEGYLFLCGRKIDMINVSGMNIYAAEIENVLALHPNVADCAVIGVPDENTGEAVVAFVQPLSPSTEAATLSSDLWRFLLLYLSPQKIPRRFELILDMPRDATGKLRKDRLRSDYLSR